MRPPEKKKNGAQTYALKPSSIPKVDLEVAAAGKGKMKNDFPLTFFFFKRVFLLFIIPFTCFSPVCVSFNWVITC